MTMHEVVDLLVGRSTIDLHHGFAVACLMLLVTLGCDAGERNPVS